MTDCTDTSTSATLLLRVQDLSDREAWEDFVARYAPQVFSWCRQNRLQESDAADVTQEVLVKLVGAMQSFAYDPKRGSFRGWLKTVTQNAVRDLVRDWQKRARGSGDSHIADALANACDEKATSALESRIAEQYETELLREAEARVQMRVKPKTWEAYRLTAVEQQPALSVSEQIGMPVSEVYVAKSRVIKMLREEVGKLEEV